MASRHIDKVMALLEQRPGASLDRTKFPVDSWARCVLDYSLNPGSSCEVPSVGSREIREARDAAGDWLPLVFKEIDHLYSIVGRVGYSVMLANADSLVLAERTDRHSNHHIVTHQLGTIWTERQVGTNGIGTCLYDRKPTTIFQHDHFFSDHVEFSCASIPLFAPDRSIWAALDVSIRHPNLHADTHALALAVTAASAERLSGAIFRKHFHTQTVIKITLPERGSGALAVDEGFAIVGADLWVSELLNLPLFFEPFSFWRVFKKNPEALRILGAEACFSNLESVDGTLFLATSLPARVRKIANVAGGYQDRRQTVPRPAGDHRITMDDWAGSEPQMIRSVGILRRLEGSRLPILLLGETGTGKDTLASAYHAESSRSSKPFVALNTAAFPESLIESELFGYESGAFTGARKEGAPGRFVQADGGTLFLDEIGDMPLQLQTRFLRVLESGEVSPLGAGKVRTVDVQIIAATNHKLERRVADGAFREDLFYRLTGVVIEVPPLRERLDLEAVIDRCVDRVANRKGLQISPAARHLLLEHDWPGNLRELYLVMHRATLLATKDVIELQDLLLRSTLRPAAGSGCGPLSPEIPHVRHRVDQADHDAIAEAMNASRGNVIDAAKILGVSRATLYRRIKIHGLSRR